MTKPNEDHASLLKATLSTALLGAIVGGTGAAAKGIRQVANDQTTKEEVAIDVAKEAGATAISAGTAGAVVSVLRLGPILSALSIIAIATGTKYAMNTVLQPAESVADEKVTIKKRHAPLVTTSKSDMSENTPSLKTATQKTTAKKSTTKKTASPKKTVKKDKEKKVNTAITESPKTETSEK